MTLADQAAITEHDGQVTEGQPARPKRRTFTAAYKVQIVGGHETTSGRRPITRGPGR